MYTEHAKDGGILSLGLDEAPAVVPPPDGTTVPAMSPASAPTVAATPTPVASTPAPAEEKLKILDLFKN
jgi:hypothetical protein